MESWLDSSTTTSMYFWVVENSGSVEIVIAEDHPINCLGGPHATMKGAQDQARRIAQRLATKEQQSAVTRIALQLEAEQWEEHLNYNQYDHQ